VAECGTQHRLALSRDQFPDTLRGNDSVIWFEPGLQDSLAWGAWLSSRLANQYRVVGANIVLATNRRLEQIPTIAPLLVRTNVVWERMRPTEIAQREADGIHVRRAAPPGLIAYGPHSWMQYGLNSQHGVALPPGRYEARFELRIQQASDPAAALVRLEAGFVGDAIVAQQDVTASALTPANLAGQDPFVATLAFAVSPEQRGRFLLLRPIHLGTADVTLRGIGLVRTD
jgi:hypothetical protein